MKEYRIYRSIRLRAQIFGLPVSLFALQMVVVLGSLLVIIFSFGLPVIVGSFSLNLSLYLFLLKLSRNPHYFATRTDLPKSISNRQSSAIGYEGH